MLTARCSAADERIAMDAGADDYLRKPFDPDELVARVDSLIAKSDRSRFSRPTRAAERDFSGGFC
jgi:DNA-binding response OmpR family regulator